MEENLIPMEDKIRQIAGRIRELRLITGFSVEEMAKRTGSTIADIRRANRPMTEEQENRMLLIPVE